MSQKTKKRTRKTKKYRNKSRKTMRGGNPNYPGTTFNWLSNSQNPVKPNGYIDLNELENLKINPINPIIAQKVADLSAKTVHQITTSRKLMQSAVGNIIGSQAARKSFLRPENEPPPPTKPRPPPHLRPRI